MSRPNEQLITSIYNKALEVHYNEWYIRNKEGKLVKLNLQGKIKCPVLNSSISSLTCSHVMEYNGWPRNVDKEVCKKCDCFINLSIKKFQERKNQKRN